MDWPKTIENVATTLVLAVVVPFCANLGALLTEFYGKQRLFFTEVQDHKPESGKRYFNVVSLINSSGHKFEKLTLNLKSTTSQGSSVVTRCFFDSEGDRGGSSYKSCPSEPINTGMYDIEIEEFSPYAKFTVAIESDREFEI